LKGFRHFLLPASIVLYGTTKKSAPTNSTINNALKKAFSGGTINSAIFYKSIQKI
jgi:hypothetical protein